LSPWVVAQDRTESMSWRPTPVRRSLGATHIPQTRPHSGSSENARTPAMPIHRPSSTATKVAREVAPSLSFARSCQKLSGRSSSRSREDEKAKGASASAHSRSARIWFASCSRNALTSTAAEATRSAVAPPGERGRLRGAPRPHGPGSRPRRPPASEEGCRPRLQPRFR
jgi:hypothetical protein